MKKLFLNHSNSIYIHIPFCKSKCHYCSFISYPDKLQYEREYILSLQKELETFSCNNLITTIYIGGGTPNILSLASFENIFKSLHEFFNISNTVEITIEINPKLQNINYLKELKNFGVNRLSVGVQSFNDNILKTLNRIHTSKEAINTLNDIKNSDFDNFSLDLIYSTPIQTINDLKQDLKIINELEPKHVSTYGLKIEENCFFYTHYPPNIPNEDLSAKMYSLISNQLTAMGFEHYEISNFAKPDYYSKHNLQYWKHNEYFGFGLAAHGFLNNIHYENTTNLEEYIKNPLSKKLHTPNTNEENFEEYLFLALRTNQGINFNYIKDYFYPDFYNSRKTIINDLISSNHAVIKNDNLILTTKGFLISDYIIGKLV